LGFAATSVAAATSAATYAAKRADVLKKCADEVRRIIPVELINF